MTEKPSLKSQNLSRVARWDYYKTHQPNYEHWGVIWPVWVPSGEWLPLLTSWALRSMRCRQVWTGQKDLKAAHCMAKTSPKDICFFRVMPPTESPKIMSLRGVHSPKALWWWGGLSCCPWCRKEGQNEGMVVNHLRTSHYHLGLICSCCMEYFTMSTDAMHQHSQLCKPALAASMMMMTGKRNLMMMTMVENMMTELAFYED